MIYGLVICVAGKSWEVGIWNMWESGTPEWDHLGIWIWRLVGVVSSLSHLFSLFWTCSVLLLCQDFPESVLSL